MNNQKITWKIIFLILSLVSLYCLTDRLIFLVFKEKTEAQILSLQKSENESDLIVELKYNVSNKIFHTNKKIKFSFNENFKGRKNIGVFYNKKSPKNIYFENYGPTIYGDIFILLMPTLLFFIGFVSIKK